MGGIRGIKDKTYEVFSTDAGADRGKDTKLINVIDMSEYARYAPSGEHSQIQGIYNEAVSLISKFEQKI